MVILFVILIFIVLYIIFGSFLSEDSKKLTKYLHSLEFEDLQSTNSFDFINKFKRIGVSYHYKERDPFTIEMTLSKKIVSFSELDQFKVINQTATSHTLELLSIMTGERDFVRYLRFGKFDIFILCNDLKEIEILENNIKKNICNN